MSWAALDDNLPTNPKILAVPVAARYLYVVGLCYCAKELTDGHIPDAALPILVASAGAPRTAVRALVDGGLWARNGTGHVIPDWLEFNLPRDEVLARRAAAAKRKADWRAKQKAARRATHDGQSRDASRDTTPQPLPDPSPEGAQGSGEHPDPPPACPRCNDTGWHIPDDSTDGSAHRCDHDPEHP